MKSTPSADGVPIAYEVTGEGSPALVFVHCWACDHHLWDAQVGGFAREHQVVTLDLAGHGASGRGRRDWTIQAFGEDVAAVVRKLDLKRVVLIGHSMGGPVILEAARRLPGRVVGLIPVDTLTNVETKESTEEIEKFLAPFERNYQAAAARFIREWMFVPTTEPKLIEKIVAQVQSALPEMAIAALRSAWTYDAAEAMQAVKVPIHALNSDKFPTNVEANRRYAPQFGVTLMKNAGHYLMLERPDEFGDLLAQVLKAVLRVAPQRPRIREKR